MKATVLVLLALLVLAGSLPTTAEAVVMCISQRGDERCHPTDGSEPPADCGFPGFCGRIGCREHGMPLWLEKQIAALDLSGGDPDAIGGE